MVKPPIRSFLIASTGLGLFVVIGCGFSMVCAYIYETSRVYCLDCYSEIGLVIIGFFMSLFITPFALAYVVQAVGLGDKPKRKRKNDEIEDTSHDDSE